MTTPNYPLALALASAGWSNHETARRLNDRAERHGHRGIAVDHTRVGRWIRHGEHPRPPIPALMALLLSDRLGQHHTPESLHLVQNPRLRIDLDHHELTAVLARVAAADQSPQEYVRALGPVSRIW